MFDITRFRWECSRSSGHSWWCWECYVWVHRYARWRRRWNIWRYFIDWWQFPSPHLRTAWGRDSPVNTKCMKYWEENISDNITIVLIQHSHSPIISISLTSFVISMSLSVTVPRSVLTALNISFVSGYSYSTLWEKF